ncbi:MAG: DUF1996 domain-containing protein, partial [Actinomycetota bacterium]
CRCFAAATPAQVAARRSQVVVYYRSRAGFPVVRFPNGLEMVAGGDTFNPPMPVRSQLSLSWGCNDIGPFFPTIPDCTTLVRAHVHFPDCWDSVHRDTLDHRSHMAFSSNGGVCPASHPVNLPRLTIHVQYFLRLGSTAELSSDMDAPAGSTLHGDFWNTWGQRALGIIVDRCLNAGTECPHLDDASFRALTS